MERKQNMISCNLCYFRGKNQNDLDNHKLLHHTKTSFFCKLCNYKSNWSTYLDHHVSTVHNAAPRVESLSSEIVGLDIGITDHLKGNKRKHRICDESEYIDEFWSSNDICINKVYKTYYDSQIETKTDIRRIKKEVSCDDISTEELNIKNEVEKYTQKQLPCTSSRSNDFSNIKEEIINKEEDGKNVTKMEVILDDVEYGFPNIKIETDETGYIDNDEKDQLCLEKENVISGQNTHRQGIGQDIDKNIPLSDIGHCVSIKNRIGKSARIYSCKLCESEFMNLEDLTEHQISFHSGQIFFCKVCIYRSDSKPILELHSKCHSNTKCDFCNFSSNYQHDVTEHIFLCHKDTYLSCDRCYYRCKYPESLIAHKVKHKEYHCDVCLIKLVTYKEFNSHMKMHPQAGCKYCKSKFVSQMNLTRHLMATKCKEKFIARQNRVDLDKPYFECDTCQYRTVNKQILRRHVRQHIGRGLYTCDLCKFTCIRHVSLVYHKMKHSGILPYCCDKCTFRSSDHSLLAMHRSSHTDNFICKICDAKFKSARYLNKHTLTHSKEKHFACKVCNALFKKKQYLKYHSTVHDDVMRFSCEKCDFKCKRRSQLKEHTVVHHRSKSFTCKVCKVVYKTTKHFKLHMLSHRDPKY